MKSLTASTPIVFILFLTAIFTSYAFMSLMQSKYQYAGDYRFVFKKFGSLLSVVALGYFVTLLFPLVAKFPFKGKQMHSVLSSVVDFADPILKYVSVIWFVFAVALLPFGHSVINTDTQELDEDRTQQLSTFYSVVYNMPYYVLYLAFAIVMFFTAVAIGEAIRKEGTPDDDVSADPFVKILKGSYENIHSTVGFYFYHPSDGGEGDAGTSYDDSQYF